MENTLRKLFKNKYSRYILYTCTRFYHILIKIKMICNKYKNDNLSIITEVFFFYTILLLFAKYSIFSPHKPIQDYNIKILTLLYTIKQINNNGFQILSKNVYSDDICEYTYNGNVMQLLQ